MPIDNPSNSFSGIVPPGGHFDDLDGAGTGAHVPSSAPTSGLPDVDDDLDKAGTGAATKGSSIGDAAFHGESADHTLKGIPSLDGADDDLDRAGAGATASVKSAIASADLFDAADHGHGHGHDHDDALGGTSALKASLVADLHGDVGAADPSSTKGAVHADLLGGDDDHAHLGGDKAIHAAVDDDAAHGKSSILGDHLHDH